MGSKKKFLLLAVFILLANKSYTLTVNPDKELTIDEEKTLSEPYYIKGTLTIGESGIIDIKDKTIRLEKDSQGKMNIEGKVRVNNSINGITIRNGKVENTGEIEVNTSKGAGIFFDKNGNSGAGEKFLQNSGKIIVKGQDAKGIYLFGNGKVENSGVIIVRDKGIGAYFGDDTPTNIEDKKYENKTEAFLIVSENSKGIYLNSKGMATNEGKIYVGCDLTEKGDIVTGKAGAIGVQVNNDLSEFTNESTGTISIYGENSKGIQVNKGTATNEGKIEANGKNTAGIYVNAGTGAKKVEFINNNQVIANGTGAKGIQFGTGGGTVTNNKDIIAKDGAIGVFFYQGKNNILVNSGTIDAGNGSAIESGKDTNNTVVLKNGSNIVGNIKGNTGVDVLVVEGGGEYKDLSITSYDKIVSLKNENSTDDAVISNSNISLEFNDGTKDYTNDELNKEKAGLTIKDSNLVVDLTNKTEGSSLVDTGDGKLTLDGNMKIAFNGGNGEKEFNISEILGDEIVANNAKFESSAMWDYTTENGDLIAKKKSYTEAVGKSQLEDFGKALEQSENGKIEDGDFKTGLTLLGLLDASQFTDAMTQLSGGVHGYTVDFAAINSRTLSNAIKNRELNKERLRDKALNSYDQEVAYINNHHKIGGLINVDYNEDGVLGITEKQIMPNGKLGLVYGGAKGKAKFENGKHGKC